MTRNINILGGASASKLRSQPQLQPRPQAGTRIRILHLTFAAISGIALLGLSACCPGVTRKVQRTQLGCEFVVYNHISNIVGGDKRYDESDIWYTNVQAMKSKDFDSVYFIAADAIYKPVHAFVGRAVWVTDNLEDVASSSYWSMPGPAMSYTRHPDVTQSKLGITDTTHGYEQALECVRLTGEIHWKKW